MRLPGVLDAAVRYLVLTAVGALALVVVPDAAFGAAPAWSFLGRPGPTPANLVGLGLIALAWLYFALIVAMRGARWSWAFVRLAVLMDACALVAFAVATAYRLDVLGAALVVAATVAQVFLLARLQHGADGPACPQRTAAVGPS